MGCGMVAQSAFGSEIVKSLSEIHVRTSGLGSSETNDAARNLIENCFCENKSLESCLLGRFSVK